MFTVEYEEGDLSHEKRVRLVSPDQNLKLIEDFSFQEFTKAVKQMHPDKSAGPDGLNPAFFQRFWVVMGREIFEYCKSWLASVEFPGELNCTNVVLIPKKKDVVCMRDLRSIALCNVLYKIMAKVLANRLQQILPDVISENQSAFVKGRSITNNILGAFEVIHHRKSKNRGTEGEVALKLDISKAYDRVNWKYLQHRLLLMGFSVKWTSWMMLCVKSVSYNFCLNVEYIRPTFPKKGCVRVILYRHISS